MFDLESDVLCWTEDIFAEWIETNYLEVYSKKDVMCSLLIALFPAFISQCTVYVLAKTICCSSISAKLRV